MEEEVRNGKKLSLYFVRHGQTYLNKNLRMQGWADTPLTPEGIEIVKESGRGLAEQNSLQRIQATYTVRLQQQGIY